MRKKREIRAQERIWETGTEGKKTREKRKK